VSVPILGAVIWALLQATVPGAAPVGGAIEVARAPGADDCPDGDTLDGLIGGILNAPSRDGAATQEVRAAVQFSRGSAGYQATLRFAGANAGQRTLTDTGSSCEALGRAVAITIALVLDATAEKAVTAPGPAPHPDVIVAPPPAASSPPRRTSGVLSATGGSAIGVVGPPAVMAGVALGVGLGRRLRFEIAGQAVAPRSAAFDTGAVEVGLVAARLSACALLNDPGSRWPVGLCARGVGGRLRGSGSGFPAENTVGALAFWAAGGGLQLERVIGQRFLVGADATVLVPLRSYTFSVGNRGVAFESPAVGAMLQLGAGVRLW
jgi:hypothetical protein